MSRVRRLEIDRKWCKGCAICVAFCRKGVLELDTEGKAVVARPEECIWCGDCEIRCPDLAVTIVTEQAS